MSRNGRRVHERQQPNPSLYRALLVGSPIAVYVEKRVSSSLNRPFISLSSNFCFLRRSFRLEERLRDLSEESRDRLRSRVGSSSCELSTSLLSELCRHRRAGFTSLWLPGEGRECGRAAVDETVAANVGLTLGTGDGAGLASGVVCELIP